MSLEVFFTPPPVGIVSYFLAAGWIMAALKFSWNHRPDLRNTTIVFVVLTGITALVPAGATIFDQLHALLGGSSQLEDRGDVPFVATMICLALLMTFGWGMFIDASLVLFKERPHLLGAMCLAGSSFLSLWTAALFATIGLGGRTDSGILKTTVECLFLAGFALAWASAVVCGRAEKRYEEAH